LKTKSAKNLASWFDDEGSADKVELSFENLEVPISKDWTDVEVKETTFTPSVKQWNSLVTYVSSLKSDLSKALEVIEILADVTDKSLEAVGDQVIHLRGSIGSRPRSLGPNLLALDLWTNVSKMSDEVADAKIYSGPSSYASMMRSMVETSNKVLKKHAMLIKTLEYVKAEYVGQVKPLEVALEDVVSDLYEPEGTFNKVLMDVFLAGAGNNMPCLQAKFEALEGQVKELSGMNMGGDTLGINGPSFTSLKSDVARLLEDNRTIKASLGGEIVKIDSEAFHSADEVKHWIEDCVGPATGTYAFFFNVTLMLESLQDLGRSSDVALDSQAISRKVNLRSVSAARMLNSFGVSVPQVMNRKNNSKPFSLVPN
jgi:hypothetical protein